MSQDSKRPPQSRVALGICVLLIAAAALFVAVPQRAQAQDAACSASVTVQSGDTLATIAGRYLGNQQAWQRIVTATNDAATRSTLYRQIANPNIVLVGQTLCIPRGASVQAIPTGGSAPAAATPVAPVRATATTTPVSTSVFGTVATATDDFDPEILTVDYLRNYPVEASPITIVERLESGVNYDRYLTTYESDGNTIYAYMTVPQGAQPATGWPIVVFNHGYIPPAIYRSTERYIAYTDGFARNGYIVFRPDYRGHGLSEGEARGAYGDPGYVIDVLNALESIKAYPVADPERVGMWGHSLGGFITLRAMVVRDDIDAGVIWAGVVGSYPDMLNNWRRANPGQPTPTPNPEFAASARRWRQAVVEEMGSPEENPAFWASISANSYLADLSGPVQIHHGTADTDVPVEFSRTLDQQIEGIGGVTEYHEYPGDNHNINGYFNTAMAESVAWFDQYVKNAP